MVGLTALGEKGIKNKEERDARCPLMLYDLAASDECCFGYLAFSSSWLLRILISYATSFCSFSCLVGLVHVYVYRLGCRWKEMGHGCRALACTHAHILRTLHATQRNTTFLEAGCPLWEQMASFSFLSNSGVYYRCKRCSCLRRGMQICGNGVLSFFFSFILTSYLQSQFGQRVMAGMLIACRLHAEGSNQAT